MLADVTETKSGNSNLWGENEMECMEFDTMDGLDGLGRDGCG